MKWEKLGTVVVYPWGEGNPNTDSGYPWMTRLEGNRWFLLFYYGQFRGPNNLYGMELDLP